MGLRCACAYASGGARLGGLSVAKTHISLTPSQADVLRVLDSSPGQTPEAIAGATLLPPGGVHWNLDRLEMLGLVDHELVRAPDGVDGKYHLTDRGRKALQAFDR